LWNVQEKGIKCAQSSSCNTTTTRKNNDETIEDDGGPIINIRPTRKAPLQKVKKVNEKEKIKKKTAKDKENDSCECSVCHNIYNAPEDPLKN
jgi:hypothetical protein